ncbi:MAG: zinc ribbon domain-containing protein [Solirubrobacterales bacterium]
MPIYEFYCPHCHRLFNFLSRSVNTDKVPPCPRCEGKDLARRASAFAISKGRKEEPARASGPEPDIDEARLERAMESMAGEMEGIDESDPRQGARFMRRMFEAAGVPVAGGMEDALRRMEAGEDPEKIEAEMGDVFETDPFSGVGEKDPAGAARGLAGLRRRLPPTVDPELYEM